MSSIRSENNKGKNIDLSKLAMELSKLHGKLKEQATTEEHHRAVHAVARATEHASQGNWSGVLTHLEEAGKWSFDIAVKIGVPLAVEAFKEVLFD